MQKVQMRSWRENPDGAENTKATKQIACPNCYGGHFRPCQWCGDTGRVTLESDASAVSKTPDVKHVGISDLLAAISERKEYLKAHQPDAYSYPTLWARWDAQLAELARTEKVVIEMAANVES
jgi:hypothetical protein